jgi:putative transcriptional regulator
MSKLGKRMIASARKTRLRLEAGKELKIHAPLDVAAIRTRLGMTQEEFARHYGFSPGAVRDWEQHRKPPIGAARTLLRVIDKEPRAVERVLEPMWKLSEVLGRASAEPVPPRSASGKRPALGLARASRSRTSRSASPQEGP